MNRLPAEKPAPIIGMMMEGMSIRAITRMTGVSKNTIAKILADAGRACAEYQDRSLRELPCKRLQLYVVSSFIYAKAKNVPDNKVGEAGDVRTRTAIDANTKLIASWFVGDRSGASARIFVSDLASCLTHRVQITTEGHKA